MVAWSRNHLNQTNVPSGLTNVASLAAGGNQSLALLRNGTVTNWGETYGSIPANLATATAIAAGSNFSLALRSNGTVVAWGATDYGQNNVPTGLSNVVAIAAGGFHALAVRANGTVVSWGANGSGQTNRPRRVAVGRMARKRLVEYSGALYHVMNRGDRREAIFKDDSDRRPQKTSP